MKHLILGASAAGINAAKTIRQLDKNCEITIISSDNNVYSRCMLHHIIGKHRDLDGISFITKDFFEKYNIHWIKNKTVTEINTKDKKVILNDNENITYDKLLIATGSSASIPPIKNLKDAKGVYTLRHIEDAEGIDEKAETCKEAAIIGAGLVGIDAAVGLLARGLKISIIEMSDRILPLQLDKKASDKYRKLLEEQGVEIHTNACVEEAILNEDGFIKGLKLDNGKEIKCDMAIVAAGVKPNISFINNSDIKVERGISINNKCETSSDSIYAAGDVCGKIGIWPLAVKQAITAAYNMVGYNKVLDDDFGLKNSMNFFRLETISIGLINPPDDSYKVDIIDTPNVYKKIIHKDGIIYGTILQGNVSYCGVLTQLIKNKIDVSNINKNIFNINYADFYSIDSDGKYQYNY